MNWNYDSNPVRSGHYLVTWSTGKRGDRKLFVSVLWFNPNHDINWSCGWAAAGMVRPFAVVPMFMGKIIAWKKMPGPAPRRKP